MLYNACVWSGLFFDMKTEAAIDTFLAAGFHHTELTICHTKELVKRSQAVEKTGMQIAEYASSRDFHIPQGHISYLEDIADDAVVDSMKKELELYAAMGIKAAVVHANGCLSMPEQARLERRVSVIQQLADHVKGTGVHICLENLGSIPETHTVERLKKIIGLVDRENVGICLDVGHLHLVNGRGEAEQSQSEFIHGAGDLLLAMHVTDNSSKGDDHLMPYSSRFGINWKEVVSSINDIGYKGLFNLELPGESKAPIQVRHMKLAYLRNLLDFMMSEDFLQA